MNHEKKPEAKGLIDVGEDGDVEFYFSSDSVYGEVVGGTLFFRICMTPPNARHIARDLVDAADRSEFEFGSSE